MFVFSEVVHCFLCDFCSVLKRVSLLKVSDKVQQFVYVPLSLFFVTYCPNPYHSVHLLT